MTQRSFLSSTDCEYSVFFFFCVAWRYEVLWVWCNNKHYFGVKYLCNTTQRSVFGICTCSWSRATRADLRSEKHRGTDPRHLTFNEWMRVERSEAVPVIIHHTNRLTVQPCGKRRPLEMWSAGEHATMHPCIQMHWTPAVAEALHSITV